MPTVFSESMNLGDLLKYEAPNLYSRDRVTVVAGQTLPLGAVVGMVTATGKVKQIDPSATDGSQYAAGVLMQAVEFANNWLRLGGGSKSSQATLPIQEMDEVRVEIRERTDAVLAALRPYASIQKSPTLRAAACRPSSTVSSSTWPRLAVRASSCCPAPCS